MSERRVVVVGGGVIGVACAHYLQRHGWAVTVIDKGTIGGACSHGNCGLVCPSHVLPLAEPGAISQAIRSLLNPDAPFRVKPRLNLGLWLWMWHFARRCNRRDMVTAGHSIQPILESSLAEYRDLVERERIDCEWQKRGLLFAYRTKAPFEAYAATNRLLAETFHAPAQRLDGDAVCELEPALKPGLAGGWYYDHDAHLRPDKLMSSWRTLLESRGATFREQCEFRGFDRMDGQVSNVLTSQGPIAADAVVVATGALTPLLSEHLGCRIPIQPGKGYSITMARPLRCPAIPLIFPEHRVAVTPMQSGYRLGSIMEFAGYDDTISPQRLELLTRGATPYLHEPTAEPVVERWTGWRPMTWDSLPIIDRAPVAENVWLAAGHNMVGISMAPGTGRLIGELVSGRPPHINPGPYSLKRFQ
ncbi:MAG: FAD-dependent oxidoreductase [Planctomycetaceae bacterium]|nr:FAD-dependent oxidoreductase [Planctomycetaceae bacterium]